MLLAACGGEKNQKPEIGSEPITSDARDDASAVASSGADDSMGDVVASDQPAGARCAGDWLLWRGWCVTRGGIAWRL